MEWFGIFVSVAIGMFMIFSGGAYYLIASGFGSVHKFDYIYPIVLIIIGLSIEYYVFFHVIEISLSVNK